MQPEMVEDLESSPESAEGVDEQSPSSDVAQTMEDAIRSAIQVSPEQDAGGDEDGDEDEDLPPAAEGSSPDDGEQVAEPDEAVEPANLDDVDAFVQMMKDNDVPLGKIERFKEVLEERKRLTARVDELQSVENRLSQLEVEGRKAGMSQEQIANLMTIPLTLASDPVKAFQQISDFRDELAMRVGEKLPADIQQRVEEGYIDEETARRLAKAEADAQANQRKYEESQQEYETRQRVEAQNAVVETINTYQRHLETSDPDYSQKHPLIKDRLVALAGQHGTPETPEQARALIEQAYKDVNEYVAQFQTKPKPSRTLSSRGETRPAQAAPKSMFEAIEAAVGAATED